MNQMQGRDLFLRYQGPKHNVVQHHRVWDATRFFETTVIENVKMDVPVLVTLATEADYIDYRRNHA